MIAVLTATQFEIPELRKILTKKSNNKFHYWVGSYGMHQIVSWITGIGQPSSSQLRLLPAVLKPKLVIIVGFSGALTNSVTSEKTYWIKNFSTKNQPDILSSFHSNNLFDAEKLLTVEYAMLSSNDKKSMSSQNPGINLVDMESYFWVQHFEKQKVPVIGLRCIFDSSHENLPAYWNKLCDLNGSLDYWGVLHTIPKLLCDWKIVLKLFHRQKLCNYLLNKELRKFLDNKSLY